MMRIAMIIQRFRPAFSGQGLQVEILTQALARRGIDVSIITAAAGRDRSVERPEGYSVVRLGADPPRFLPVRWRQRLRIKQYVRGGGMRRSPLDSTNRSLAAF